MTPSEYISRIEDLIREGRDEEALDLAARVGPEMMARLPAEGFWRVSSLLEGAELAVSVEGAPRVEPDAEVHRPARHSA